MARGFVTGPAPIFCGVGGNKAPLHLGWAEVTPRIEIRPAFSPFFNSVFSPKVPMDLLMQGEEAFVIADVNMWTESVYAAIASRPNAGGTRMLQPAGELGSFMIFEGYSYPIWVQFTYQSKPAMSAMPAGYHFYNAALVGPDTLEPLGMDASKRRLIWHCLPALSVGPNNTTLSSLGNHDMSNLPAVTLT